jgi:hypothetical protein
MKYMLLLSVLCLGCGGEASSIAKPTQRVATATQPPDYLTVDGEHLIVRRADLFEMCRQIPDANNAEILFSLMMEWWGKYEDKYGVGGVNAKLGESWDRKNGTTYSGYAWTNGDKIRFAIMANVPAQPGDNILDELGRTNREMRRRMEEWVGHKVY